MLAALVLTATLVRLTPAAFPALPADVRQDLKTRGCTIPQVWDDTTPHNVIRGRFTSNVKDEWAVLCSRNGASAILVFRADGGVDELARRDDADFVTSEGFCRLLRPASPRVIRAYFAYHGKKAPRLSHDGVDDHFEPKASTVHYFARGRWLRWAGAD